MARSSGNSTTRPPQKAAALPRNHAAVEAAGKLQIWLRNAGIIVAGSLLIAIGAHVSLPLGFTPVPLTMQTFAVVLLGLICGPVLGASAAALYLIEAAVGLPVLSPHAAPGLLHLVGPTGGYLMAYPAAAWLAGYLPMQLRSRTYPTLVLSAFAASVVVLALGAMWLGILVHPGMRALMIISVLPFVPGDVLKCFAAGGAAYTWFRWRRQN